MHAILIKPMLGMLGLGGAELLVILAVGMVFFIGVALIVGLILFFTRPVIPRKDSPPPFVPPRPAQPPVAAQTAVLPRQCPQCGAALKPDAPEGLCPACLLQRGIATESGVPAGKPSFTPPPVSELTALFPQLEILECLGRGGMGAVYKARQPRLERFVALKILSPEKQNDAQFAERFGREARALARLNHPNIVTVYDFGEVQGRFYLLMEFVDGLTLRQVLAAGKLAPAEALKIVPKICEALQYAHEQGIIHRDIKPENILIDRQGRVKIADFGIAKIAGLESTDLSLTGAKDVMGTPHYMAPEQVEQPQAVDHRADIYSLGVVFYEMLTGELPLGKFAPPSAKAAMDTRLDQVVMHALEKEPAQRYQQANQVKTDVETIASGPISPGTSPGIPPIAPTPIQPAAPSPVTVPADSSKAMLPAFLLAFFFGIFGVHRFYVGKLRSGLLQLGAAITIVFFIIILSVSSNERADTIFGILLGFWIVGCLVWAIVDWILILCKAFTDGEGKRITHWTHADFRPSPSSASPSPDGGGSGAGRPPRTEKPPIAGGSLSGSTNNQMLITAPAVALMVAAGWNILRAFVGLSFFSTGNNFISNFPDELGFFRNVVPLAIGSIILFHVIPALFVLYGGYQMLHRRSYAWSLAAGIISIVACSLFGFPAGVWAVIVLALENVRAVFRSAATDPARYRPPTVAPMVALFCGLLIVLLSVLFGAHALWEHTRRFMPESNPPPRISSGLPQMNFHQVGGESQRDFDQTFALTPDGHFDLDNVNGRIEIHGWDNDKVAMQAVIHGRNNDSVNEVAIDVTHEADRFRIHTDQPSNQSFNSADSFWDWLFSFSENREPTTVDYVIHAPHHARLDGVTSVNGTISIDGMDNNITTSTANGQIRIKDAAADLKVSTVNGGINIGMDSLAGSQHVSLDTVNGEIDLAVPTNADARFSLSTVNGGISSDFPGLSPKKNFPVGSELNGNLGDGSAEVHGTTVNGGFHITKRGNTADD